MFFAVQASVAIIASKLSVLRSHFLNSAISSRSVLESFAILFLLGSQDHFFCCVFRKIRFDVTRPQISNLNVLSAKTVNTHLTFISYHANFCITSCVLSLNSLINCPIFTQLAQSIGPSGGDG